MRTFFKYVGYIMASAAIIGLIGKIAVDGYKVKEGLNNIQVNQIDQVVRYDSLTNILNKLNNNLLVTNKDVSDIKIEQRIQGRKQDNLKALVIQEFAKTMNSQQVLDMINMLEKKNNNSMTLQY